MMHPEPRRMHTVPFCTAEYSSFRSARLKSSRRYSSERATDASSGSLRNQKCTCPEESAFYANQSIGGPRQCAPEVQGACVVGS
jgi:hypothetical protein